MTHTMSSDGARKDMKTIQGIIRRKGYKTAPSGGGHWLVLDKHGTACTDEHGRVVISSSPSDYRARDLAWARLERAGIVTSDDNPWKPQKRKGGKGVVVDDGDSRGDGSHMSKQERKLEEKHKERMRRDEVQRTRHERTQLLRGRLEPLLTALGGWSKRGMAAEIGAVVYDFAKDTPFAFPSKQAATSNVASLRKGGTLSDQQAQAWDALLEDLERAPNLTDRWFDLVRAARGMPSRAAAVVGYHPGGIVDPEPVRLVVAPPTGAMARALDSRHGNGDARERYTDDEHPVLEFHRNGGVRWNVDTTIDDLNDLNRALGVLEGLSVQLALFDGGALVEQARERVERFVIKAGEARHNELKRRAAEEA